ncbi:MAG: hypothetical protein MUF74_14900, partial [Cypionkella sp.]|nr:hypothetical protein [Cypionkella sp.]
MAIASASGIASTAAPAPAAAKPKTSPPPSGSGPSARAGFTHSAQSGVPPAPVAGCAGPTH